LGLAVVVYYLKIKKGRRPLKGLTVVVASGQPAIADNDLRLDEVLKPQLVRCVDAVTTAAAAEAEVGAEGEAGAGARAGALFH
jgi:hypothetical protein